MSLCNREMVYGYLVRLQGRLRSQSEIQDLRRKGTCFGHSND